MRNSYRNRCPSLLIAIRAGALIVLLSLTLAPAHSQEQKPPRATLNLLQDAFSQIAEQVEPAVVTVVARKVHRPKAGAPESDDEIFSTSPFGRGRSRSFRSQGTGSGVILSADGWVLTNDHVVGGADKVTIKLNDGREFDGTVKRDYRSDLALVKITASNLVPARLGDSDRLKVGHWAIAIGSPYRYEGSLSVGVVSSLFRRQEISVGSEGPRRLYPNMIQTDAAINPGNSGGPLMNIEGEVIGINTAIETDTGGSVGIGFAIPINLAKYVIDQLKTRDHVSWGYLGIEPDTITPKLASAYKVANGAYVRGDPEPGSPADKAGIQVDDVITEIDGRPVKSELDLRSTVSRIVPGKTVEIVLVRSGMEKRVKATIQEAPNPLTAAAAAAPAATALGIDVVALTAESARKAGIDEKTQGVLIKTVDGGSAASESDLQHGDVILRVNDVPMANVEAFKKITDAARSGDVLHIVFSTRRANHTTRRTTFITVD